MRRSSVRFRPPAPPRAALGTIATMRPHGSPARFLRLAFVLGATTLCVIAMAQGALAQETIDPTVTPVKDTGGWVYWMAEGAIVIGGGLLPLAGGVFLPVGARG